MSDSDIPNQYVCELCKKEFSQKIDYTRHKNKKSPCISIEQIQSMAQGQELNTNTREKLKTIFTYCLNVLRDNEHLTGDKALRTLAHLLDLRLLEPQFGTTIDIEGNYYDFSDYDDTIVDRHKAKLFEIVKFSNLAKEPADNIPTQMKYLWDEILSVHPVTKNIFLKGKGFDIQHQSTYKKLIDKLFEFKFENMDEDILGEAYEEVIKDVMVGKTLGQFFTPPSVKQMMVELVDPQIKTDGTCETVYDPAMGTGGFLITCLRHMMKKSKTLNIPLNWDYITNNGIGGREPEPDTFQLAVSNMLIASGHMLNHLEKGDSIRNTITNKYDIILANPPYGIKGLNYFEIVDSLRNEYLPISSNSAVPLFIQAIIYILNIGGRCAVVLPEGQELFSKNRALAAVREFLMKTCDLKEVIYLPAGTFTHTSIKTCVLYFHKKKEGKDVLKIDIKISPTTQQEIQRDYKFSATHQTHKVAFYDYNPSNGVKHLHVEVNISDIAKKNYSLNYAEYLKDDAEDAIYEEGVVVKSLGDVCNFDIGGTPSRSNIEYYQNGTNYWLSVRELNGGHIFDTNEKITDLGVNKSSVKLFPVGTVLFSFKLSIGKTAVAGVPLYTNEAIAGLNTKNENMLLNKYLYHYLTVNDFTQHGSGMLGNGSLNKKSLYDIKIPIPPLEKQQEIVKYMDFIYETANKSSEQKIKELKQLNEYCLNMQKGFGLNSIKPLGEVIESVKTGIDIVAESRIKGIYPFYGANGIIDNVNCFLFDGKYLLTARTGSLGSLHITDGKFWCTGDVHCIKFNDDITLSYIYQYLHTIDFQKFRTGAAHPKLSGSALKSINIHIPDIERQKEIVEYCEYNDNLIKQLEREIEQNKKQAQMFLANIIKVVGTKPATESETITPANEPSDQVTPVTNDDAVSVTSSSSEPNPQAELDPAKFEQEYLSQQSLSNLKQMKKQYKIRAKVTEDTVEEYVRILREWYVKQTAEKPKKRTKKPVVTQHTIEQVTNTALTLDVTVPTA